MLLPRWELKIWKVLTLRTWFFKCWKGELTDWQIGNYSSWVIWNFNPFCRERNEFEYESPDTTRCRWSEFLYVHSFDNRLVEVSYKRSHQQIDHIFSHEWLWQSFPAESIVHVVKDSFLPIFSMVMEFSSFLIPLISSAHHPLRMNMSL